MDDSYDLSSNSNNKIKSRKNSQYINDDLA